MIEPPQSAFILAAGLGTRLRPYTDHCPKPMVRIAGRSIIDRALDRLEAAGVREVCVNLHYMADVLEAHLRARTGPKIRFFPEPALLNTGGGVKKALDFMQNAPFYILNGDALWTDGPSGPALLRLAEAFDPARMDLLLLLQPVESMVLTQGVGDYDLDAAGAPFGKALRRTDQRGSCMFTGIRVVHPRLFENTPEGPFSFLTLMDRAQEAGRLFGLIHDGDWHHISTPGDLERVDTSFLAHPGAA